MSENPEALAHFLAHGRERNRDAIRRHPLPLDLPTFIALARRESDRRTGLSQPRPVERPHTIFHAPRNSPNSVSGGTQIALSVIFSQTTFRTYALAHSLAFKCALRRPAAMLAAWLLRCYGKWSCKWLSCSPRISDVTIDVTSCFSYAYVLFPFRPRKERVLFSRSPAPLRDLGA